MSSILKALKKLEQEKAIRGERPVDLAVDIHRGARRQRQNLLVPVVCLLIGLILASGVAWLIYAPATGRLHKRSQQPSPASPLAPLVHLPESPVAPAGPATTAPAAADLPPSVSPPGSGVKSSHGRNVASKRETAPARPASRVTPPAQEPGASGEDRQSPGALPAPDLRLTGIVWQEDAASRMAIINDLPVMVGTVIEGARVVEIRPDQVVLESDGKKTELHLQP